MKKAFDLNGHDEKISEIYSKLIQNVDFCLDETKWVDLALKFLSKMA